jgi:DNA-binding HxlR family transcriptional regulator
MLNGEWITPTLVALSSGPLHYSELYSAIQGMSSFDRWTGAKRVIQGRALIRTLRRLEAAGLVLRHEERVFPRSVVYSLTDAAADLLNSARPAIDWVERHLDLIERLQKSQAKGRKDAADTDAGEGDEV